MLLCRPREWLRFFPSVRNKRRRHALQRRVDIFDALANFFQKEKLHGAALNIPHHDAKSSHKSSTRTPHDSRGVKKSREELTQRAGKAANSDWFFGEPRRV